MTQEVAPRDIVIGLIVIVVFLIGAFAVGRLLSAWKNRRFTAAWAPLIPLINGTVHSDGGGAASSWLTGTYRGYQVKATMIPERNRYTEGVERYNYFDVALLDVSGQQNWQIIYQTAVLGLGNTGWHITADDPTLKARVHTSGIMAELARLGTPTVEYAVRTHSLLYSEDVTPRWVPTAERFQEALEILLRLAAINEELSKR